MAVNRRPQGCLYIKWMDSGDTENTIFFSYKLCIQIQIVKRVVGFRVLKPSAGLSPNEITIEFYSVCDVLVDCFLDVFIVKKYQQKVKFDLSSYRKTAQINISI